MYGNKTEISLLIDVSLSTIPFKSFDINVKIIIVHTMFIRKVNSFD